MKAINKIAKRLNDSTLDPDTAVIFRDLIEALHEKREFQLNRFYDLNYSDFDLALLLLVEWRLQRFGMVENGLKGLLQVANTAQHTHPLHA